MKTGFGLLIAVAILIAFSGCANGKKVQEQTSVHIGQPFYTTWSGGVRTAGSGLNLYIPVDPSLVGELELDSVYFRGRKAKLEAAREGEKEDYALYVAYFRTAEKEKAPDLVMHRDPKQEYGNRAPEIIRDFPFELEEDEAMLTYKKDGKTGYYRVSGIKRSTEEVQTKIKRPQDLQH